MAVAVADAGADVVAVSSTVGEVEHELRQDISKHGGTLYPYQVDLSDAAACRGLAQQLRSDQIPVDTLINNAGIIRRAPVLEHSYDDWEAILQINLNAGFVLSQELGKDMAGRGFGRIIFIGSLLSFQGGITVPAYAASKGAVKQLVMAMSNELAPAGITVNAIAPGYIATAATQALRNDRARSKQILDRIPKGRWGEPDDIGGTAVFLASHAADYITGTTIVVDGGWLAR
jgi:2-deoxy-D-gluconate 3-dehydrogenase